MTYLLCTGWQEDCSTSCCTGLRVKLKKALLVGLYNWGMETSHYGGAKKSAKEIFEHLFLATWKATVGWVLNTRRWRRTALSHCCNESLNIICLINRLEHFTSLFYLHSGCWSDNLILLSIYHNCLRLKASIENYRATGSNNGAGFTAYRMCWFLNHLDRFTFQCNVWLLFLRLLEIFSTEQYRI